MLDKGNTAAVQSVAETSVASLPARFEKVKSLLQKESGDTAFRSWIAPIEVLSSSGGILELSVPTRFIRDWVKTHYADRIKSLWTQHYGALRRVDLVIAAKKPVAAPFVAAESANENATGPIVQAANTLSPLDPRFTFDNFVTGPSNELAAAAARKVADSDAVVFNPLFLHGGVGLGKTHLMHAIAWRIQERAPKRKVAYLSAEKFMCQFIQSLRTKDMMAFKAQFRNVDVLMVDDIQFICGKEATQEEFFHTFNALVDMGKQVIVSADRSPSCLDGLDARLRSRLGGGLAADIQPADYDLRLGILKSKCKMLRRDVPEDVLAFLAEKITSNVRELEGALNRLIANAELVNRPITLESTGALLQDLLRAQRQRVTVEDIQKQVAEHYGIRIADMHSPRRSRAVARPRQVAMYLCKILTEHSLPAIGGKFGGRDHTTIIHGVRKIEELLRADHCLQEDVETLKRALAG